MAYTAKLGWPPRQFKAFVYGFFFVLSLAKFVVIVASGLAGWELPNSCLIAIPCIFLGQYLGMRVFTRVPATLFRRLVFVLLAICSLGMVARALTSGA